MLVTLYGRFQMLLYDCAFLLIIQPLFNPGYDVTRIKYPDINQ